MRRSGPGWAGLWVTSVTAGVVFGVGHAQAQIPAQALIWYRSAEGCPDGAAFLGRLETRGVHARLAEVGDPIDFVVTLGRGADGASGLLERQTRTGTVAIRRVEGGTCDEVADGVALSLSLAEVPGEHREATTALAATATARESPMDETTPNRQPLSQAGTPAADDEGTTPAARAGRARWSIGAQGSVATGVAPSLMPGGALFVDFTPGQSSLLVGSSWRLSAVGGARSSLVDGHDANVWLVGGSLDGCPARLGSDAVHVSPCASVELGALGASGGSGPGSQTAIAGWAAVRALLRLEWRVAEPVALEAQIDAAEHLTRYEIVAETPERTLYRTAPVGLGLGAGAKLALP